MTAAAVSPKTNARKPAAAGRRRTWLVFGGGLNIQTGFELGEWVANIDTEGITYGPVDDPEYYAATVTQSEENT